MSMGLLQETYDEQQNLSTILCNPIAGYSATIVLHVNQIHSCLDLFRQS